MTTQSPLPDQFSTPLVVVLCSTLITNQDEKTPVTLYILDNPEGCNNINDITNSSIVKTYSAYMRIRGCSTSGLPSQQLTSKLQYSVTLAQDEPAPEKHFLNMPHGGRHWVFNDCGIYDPTMLRNTLTFKMQRKLGAWAPRTKYFEMFLCLNQSSLPTVDEIKNSYHGVYLLTEKIRKESHRIDLEEFSTASGVGSMIIQINHSDSKYLNLIAGNPPIQTPTTVEVYEPKLDDLTSKYNSSELSSIETLLQNWFYTATPLEGWYNLTSWSGWAGIFNNLWSASSLTAEEQETICRFTDITSFAQYFLLNEISKDPDGYHKSTFMYKESDKAPSSIPAPGSLPGADVTPGKMFAGPLWDKNKAYGNTVLNYTDYQSPEGWLYSMSSGGQAPCWWDVLLKTDKFKSAVQSIWEENFKNPDGAFNFQFISPYLMKKAEFLSTEGSSDGSTPLNTPIEREIHRWKGLADVATSQDWQNNNQIFVHYIMKRLLWIDNNLKTLTS